MGHSSAATPLTAPQLSHAQLLHLQQCFRARQQVLSTLAAQGPVAPATRAGIAKYLDGPGAGCRLMQRGEEGDRQPSSAHMHLVHLVRAGRDICCGLAAGGLCLWWACSLGESS